MKIRSLLGFVAGICVSICSFVSAPELANAAPCATPTAHGNYYMCDFSNQDLSNLDLSGANFVAANLSGANLSGANLSGSDLTFASFAWTNLRGANFTNAVVGNTGFRYAIATDVNFTNANLAGASLWEADVSNSNFSGAKLDGAELKSLTITNADFTTARFDHPVVNHLIGSTSKLPPGWSIVSGFFIGPGAYLSGDLTGADFSSSDLSGVLIGPITCTPFLYSGCFKAPAGWQLVVRPKKGWAQSNFGYIVGPGANLSRADFSDLDLSGMDFSDTDLSDANFAGATLTGIKSGGVVGQPTLPVGWCVTRGYIVGWSANLTNADLRGATFVDVNLRNATLTGVKSGGIGGQIWEFPSGWQYKDGYLIGPGADLSGANLDGLYWQFVQLDDVSSGGITGTPLALPRNWRIVNGYLVGPHANLSGANLSGANLRNVSLQFANLTNANLQNADLVSADLTSATLTGANLTGAATLANANWIPSDWINKTLLGWQTIPSAELVGVSKTGQTLQATINNASETSYRKVIQWLSDGIPITGETNPSYVVQPKDIGHRISFSAEVLANGYQPVSLTSYSALISIGTMTVSPPTVAGKIKVGSKVTASATPWTPGASLSYQWLLDGKAIKNATKSSYTIGKTQKGHKISLKVSQTANGFSPAESTSKVYKVG